MRSPGLLALSVSLLAASAVLGVLVHDGEVGLSGSDRVAPGDGLRLKGGVGPAYAEESTAAEALMEHTVAVDGTGFPGMVLVTSDAPLPDEGTWVVEGTVAGLFFDQRPILVVIAERLSEPLVFA